MADLDMLLDRVDAHGRTSGTVRRRAVFTSQANFRVAHLFLFNSQGDLLLQKIAPGLRHEGMWGSSAAGYVARGDDYLRTVARKAKEELGVSSLTLVDCGQTMMRDNGCKKFIGLFTATHDGTVILNLADASGLEFVSIRDIDGMRTDGTRRFTKTFLHLFDYYRRGVTPGVRRRKR